MQTVSHGLDWITMPVEVSPKSIRSELRPFDPRAVGEIVGYKLFGELHLEIQLHFIE